MADLNGKNMFDIDKYVYTFTNMCVSNYVLRDDVHKVNIITMIDDHDDNECMM